MGFRIGRRYLRLRAAHFRRRTHLHGQRSRKIYALDAATGCIKWTYQAGGPVREAVATAPLDNKQAVLFGDLTGTFYALEARLAASYEKHIEEHEAALLTGSPVVYQGNVDRGHCVLGRDPRHQPRVPLLQFSRKRGRARRARWSASLENLHHHDTPHPTRKTTTGTIRQGPSGAGIWSAPTIDPKRGALYVTTGDNYSAPSSATSDAVLALDLTTGRMLWSRQVTPGDVFNSGCVAGVNGPNCPDEGERGPDYDFGSSAILVKAPKGRDLLIAGQKSGMVYALGSRPQGRDRVDPTRRQRRHHRRRAMGNGQRWTITSMQPRPLNYFFTKDQVRVLAPDQGRRTHGVARRRRHQSLVRIPLNPVDPRLAAVPRNRLR